MSGSRDAAPRLLLLGGTGRLGGAVLACPSPFACAAPGRTEFDLYAAGAGDHDALLAACRPRVALNAAAMAGVDACSRDPDRAHAVNARAAGLLAGACARAGVPLIHVSTDYVFGDPAVPAPYAEHAAPCPVQVYGVSKADGERGVRAAGGGAVVVRVSWLFGALGAPFVRFVLAQAARGPGAPVVVARQASRPTFLPDLAAWLLALAGRLAAGQAVPQFLHPAGGPAGTRAEWARLVLDAAGHPRTEVVERDSFGWEGGARRPADCRLDGSVTSAWSDAHGLPPLRDWREVVADVAAGGPGVR